MNIWLERIFMGCSIYRIFALSIFVPIALGYMIYTNRINLVRLTLNQMFCFYMCCLFALVFLPLPTMEAAANLTYDVQWIPFYALYDIAVTRSAGAVFCLVFNIVMTIPFGMFLRYYMNMNLKQVLILGFALTLFIEIGQFTGLFGMFHGSYRLCDVDDLITNTLGTYIGYLMVARVESFIPVLSSFDLKTGFDVPALNINA